MGFIETLESIRIVVMNVVNNETFEIVAMAALIVFLLVLKVITTKNFEGIFKKTMSKKEFEELKRNYREGL